MFLICWAHNVPCLSLARARRGRGHACDRQACRVEGSQVMSWLRITCFRPARRNVVYQTQCNLLVWFFGAQYSANCGVTYIYGPPVSE